MSLGTEISAQSTHQPSHFAEIPALVMEVTGQDTVFDAVDLLGEAKGLGFEDRTKMVEQPGEQRRGPSDDQALFKFLSQTFDCPQGMPAAGDKQGLVGIEPDQPDRFQVGIDIMVQVVEYACKCIPHPVEADMLARRQQCLAGSVGKTLEMPDPVACPNVGQIEMKPADPVGRSLRQMLDFRPANMAGVLVGLNAESADQAPGIWQFNPGARCHRKLSPTLNEGQSG